MKNIADSKYTKFVLYLIVVVLINAVGMNVFFRADLTDSGLYSISSISREVVSTLSEPLTIHVFFSDNLPAPHNNTRRYLEDLLKEYAVYGNRFFNYRFHDIRSADTPDRGATSPESYGIYPLQLQYLKNDEIKLLKAYMGLVLIHGDMVEQIPQITSTRGIEYRITTAVQKMHNKIGALLGLEDPIQVKLVLSSSLQSVAPYMKLNQLMGLPQTLERLTKEISERHYGKLEYAYVDPTRDPQVKESLKKYRLMELSWPDLQDASGKMIAAGEGVAGLIVEHQGSIREFQLIQAVNIPLIGTQYRLVEPEQIEKLIEEGTESLLDINADIGYLEDHETLSLFNPMASMQRMENPDTITNFNNLVKDIYTLKPVNLTKDGIGGAFDTLIIAGPKEEFSQYELFVIDQFLMQGKNLAVFLDPFKEVMPQQNMNYMNRNQGPVYLPLDTGLEKLLFHYGVTVRKAYVMDEKCLRQQVDEQFGGGEQVFYFAPEIQQEYIDNSLPFMQNLNRLVLLRTAPLEVDAARLEKNSIHATTLFSSSPRSWEMSNQINLNPFMIRKPQDPAKYQQYPLALMLEGEFSSFFADKAIPEQTQASADRDNAEGVQPLDGAAKKADAIDMSKVKDKGSILRRGKSAKIFIVGTSDILRDNVIDARGQGQNAIFVLNLLDHLNQRDGIAMMRSKQQTVALLKSSRTTEGAKTFAKTFNIAGLPLLVVLAGLAVWWKRNQRKRRLRSRFSPAGAKGGEV
ncbi:MAG TPA: ABC transporter permease [Candidatus Aminicenantes bacterium]|nr:ABC transporter permease [Candidatus Aminicenantes bacterium]